TPVDAIATVSTPQRISQTAHLLQVCCKKLKLLVHVSPHRFLSNILRPKADCYVYFMSEEACT
ncbi:MAG: hypothetical protein WAU04_00390, partial [Candidatus Nitrotoga sp.]